ncbi:hypothetical protein [Eggerthella sinensis]|uniref:hypothetical protein n=1 Tax=Eggerthella sinensis TaxID=242230 RepID=UPI0022E54B88|nr:hypothetical protein [Eggerthella sinensis]
MALNRPEVDLPQDVSSEMMRVRSFGPNPAARASSVRSTFIWTMRYACCFEVNTSDGAPDSRVSASTSSPMPSMSPGASRQRLTSMNGVPSCGSSKNAAMVNVRASSPISRSTVSPTSTPGDDRHEAGAYSSPGRGDAGFSTNDPPSSASTR